MCPLVVDYCSRWQDPWVCKTSWDCWILHSPIHCGGNWGPLSNYSFNGPPPPQYSGLNWLFCIDCNLFFGHSSLSPCGRSWVVLHSLVVAQQWVPIIMVKFEWEWLLLPSLLHLPNHCNYHCYQWGVLVLMIVIMYYIITH